MADSDSSGQDRDSDDDDESLESEGNQPEKRKRGIAYRNVEEKQEEAIQEAYPNNSLLSSSAQDSMVMQ